jgi:hypothetical protein
LIGVGTVELLGIDSFQPWQQLKADQFGNAKATALWPWESK